MTTTLTKKQIRGVLDIIKVSKDWRDGRLGYLYASGDKVWVCDGYRLLRIDGFGLDAPNDYGGDTANAEIYGWAVSYDELLKWYKLAGNKDTFGKEEFMELKQDGRHFPDCDKLWNEAVDKEGKTEFYANGKFIANAVKTLDSDHIGIKTYRHAMVMTGDDENIKLLVMLLKK